MANFVDKTDPTKYTSTSPRFNTHYSVQGECNDGYSDVKSLVLKANLARTTRWLKTPAWAATWDGE